MNERETIKINTSIGRWRIVKIYKIGPFTHVNVRCTCKARILRLKVPLASLIRGHSLSCGCWLKEIRAQTYAPMKAAREEILKRFFPAYTPQRSNKDP